MHDQFCTMTSEISSEQDTTTSNTNDYQSMSSLGR